jgi:hypothetical protein
MLHTERLMGQNWQELALPQAAKNNSKFKGGLEGADKAIATQAAVKSF